MAATTHLLIAFLLLTTTAVAQGQTCNPDDKVTLLKFKAAVGNPDVLSSWNPDSDCCNGWYIVRCNLNGRVTSLFIEEDNHQPSRTRLSGRIPDEVTHLPHLEVLVLRELPQLKGPIPAGIAKLFRLCSLSIIDTQVSGEILSSLGEIKTLESLLLRNNALSGLIPASLATLPNLTFLYLSDNQLAGTIPDVAGGFPKLEYVDLSNNRLTGFVPPSFLNLNLRSVYLSNNQLAGDVPPLFDEAVNINISRNSFSFDFGEARIPTGILILDISHNKIYGKIPTGIKRLEQPPASVNFDVSYNQLCGKVPGGKWRKKLVASSFSHNLCLCGAYDLPPCFINGVHPQPLACTSR